MPRTTKGAEKTAAMIKVGMLERHRRTKPIVWTCRCGLKFTDQNSLADHRFFCDSCLDFHKQPEVDKPQQVTA